MGNYIVVLLVRKMNEGIFRNLLEIRKKSYFRGTNEIQGNLSLRIQFIQNMISQYIW